MALRLKMYFIFFLRLAIIAHLKSCCYLVALLGMSSYDRSNNITLREQSRVLK